MITVLGILLILVRVWFLWNGHGICSLANDSDGVVAPWFVLNMLVFGVACMVIGLAGFVVGLFIAIGGVA